MLAHGADRLEEPEWESGSFFFVKIKCLPKYRRLTEKQKAYRETEGLSRNRMLTEKQNAYQNTECLPGNETHTQENNIFTRNRNTDRDAE